MSIVTVPPMPPDWTARFLRLALAACVGLAGLQYTQMNNAMSNTAQSLESVAKIVAQNTVQITSNAGQIMRLDRRVYEMKGTIK